MGAMTAVKDELESHGWNITLVFDESNCRARLDVEHSGKMDFVYEVRPRRYAIPAFAFPEIETVDRPEGKYARAEVFLREGGKAYDIYGYEKDLIISDIVDQFEKHRHFLHVSSGLAPAMPVD